jgi:hypothetical protein
MSDMNDLESGEKLRATTLASREITEGAPVEFLE